MFFLYISLMFNIFHNLSKRKKSWEFKDHRLHTHVCLLFLWTKPWIKIKLKRMAEDTSVCLGFKHRLGRRLPRTCVNRSGRAEKSQVQVCSEDSDVDMGLVGLRAGRHGRWCAPKRPGELDLRRLVVRQAGCGKRTLKWDWGAGWPWGPRCWWRGGMPGSVPLRPPWCWIGREGRSAGHSWELGQGIEW